MLNKFLFWLLTRFINEDFILRAYGLPTKPPVTLLESLTFSSDPPKKGTHSIYLHGRLSDNELPELRKKVDDLLYLVSGIEGEVHPEREIIARHILAKRNIHQGSLYIFFQKR